MKTSLLLIAALVAVAGCVSGPSPAEQRQQATGYKLHECGEFSVPRDLPDREYFRTGAVFAIASGLSYAGEGVCIAACKQNLGTDEECINKCDGIGFDPIQRYSDPYEPHNPELETYLPSGKGPHSISGTFTSADVPTPFYWDERARGRIIDTLVYVRGADLTYEVTEKLTGDLVLYGELDVNNQSRTVSGTVTQIFRGTERSTGKPLLKAALDVDVKGFCADVQTGIPEGTDIPFQISETSGNADAVDFKLVFYNTTEIPQGTILSIQKQGLRAAIGQLTNVVLKAFTFVYVFSERDYDTLSMNDKENWALHVAMPPGTTKSFAGVLYVRADNAAGFIMPVVIKPV